MSAGNSAKENMIRQEARGMGARAARNAQHNNVQEATCSDGFMSFTALHIQLLGCQEVGENGGDKSESLARVPLARIPPSGGGDKK